ncbi:MAG: hypothetical protein KKC99_00625, partial [Proteobacteria bacterium]|nr:hypothetical protein [Pseudomonadota bacterium]
MALLSLPAQAGQGKSLVAAITMDDAQGKPLLSLTLDGGCTFDPEPVCRVALADTRIDTSFFSGPAQGTALVRLAPEKLLLEEVDITMPGARLTLGEGHDEPVDL